MTAPGGVQPGLEVLRRSPDAVATRASAPLLFVHGGFAAAWCWDEFFLDFFVGRGWHTHAVSLRGHGASEGHEALHGFGIDDYVADIASVVAGLDRPAVLVGHSMGGFVVQKYFERHDAAAAVLLAPVPASGLAGPGTAMAITNPGLFWDLGMVHEFGSLFANASRMHETLFAGNVPEAVVRRYAGRLTEESHRAWLDMSGYNLPSPARMRDVPVLVIGGAEDTIIPPAFVKSAARLVGARAEILPDLGHALMLEPGWERVAERIADWLVEHGF